VGEEAVVLVVAGDEVIEEVDVEDVAGLDEFGGYLFVCSAGFGVAGWVVVEQAGGYPACCCGLVEFWICGDFWRWFGAPGLLVEVAIFHKASDFYDGGFCAVDGTAAVGTGFFPYFIDLALCDNSGAFFYEAVRSAGGACIFCDNHDDAPFPAC
jgi:hypothetical protein